MKPFIKWAGGKTQLLDILNENLNYECDKYIETFVGGGALFISLLENIEKTNIKKIIINDINEKLIITYKTIKNNIEELINELEKIRDEYNSLKTLEEKSDMFYKIREEFNKQTNDNIKISRNFIFLNKTCFNGLYRENSKGEYNVPFGKRKKISLFEKDNLLELSKFMNKKINEEDVLIICNKNYNELLEYMDNNTMIYLDPPYRPITTNGFTTYNKSNFNDKNQIELANFCNEINNIGAKFMLSNSDPHNLDINDNFFDNLYQNYNIQRVGATRRINSDGNNRGEITEILIKNY